MSALLRPTLIFFCTLALLAAGLVVRDYLRGAAFVIRATGMPGWLQTLARWPARPFVEQSLTLPTRHGSLRARLYLPAERPGRTILFVPGMHALGIAEPRVVRFARDTAAAGIAVVTAELPDLLDYQITPRSPDMIEDAVRVVAGRGDAAPDGRVGLVGISFAGGLALVAAGRETIRDDLAFVLSFGGYGDLPRVLRYLCTGLLPDGSRQPPHDYGVVIILLAAAEHLVPPGQVEPLRQAIRTFLTASHLDMTDKAAAREAFARAGALEAALPEPAATLMRYVNTRDVEALGPRLLPLATAFAAEAALSPERSPATTAPVYLLHGEGDTVIPAGESAALAAYLEPSARVRRLVTPLITHAEVEPSAAIRETWRVVAFWTALLGEWPRPSPPRDAAPPPPSRSARGRAPDAATGR